MRRRTCVTDAISCDHRRTNQRVLRTCSVASAVAGGGVTSAFVRRCCGFTRAVVEVAAPRPPTRKLPAPAAPPPAVRLRPPAWGATKHWLSNCAATWSTTCVNTACGCAWARRGPPTRARGLDLGVATRRSDCKRRSRHRERALRKQTRKTAPLEDRSAPACHAEVETPPAPAVREMIGHSLAARARRAVCFEHVTRAAYGDRHAQRGQSGETPIASSQASPCELCRFVPRGGRARRAPAHAAARGRASSARQRSFTWRRVGTRCV